MSNLGLFIVGTFVTLLVAAAMALLIWGAVLDGRDDRAERRPKPEGAISEGSVLSVVDAA